MKLNLVIPFLLILLLLALTHFIGYELGASSIRKNIVVNKYDNKTMYNFYGKCYNEFLHSYCANLKE